MIYSLLILVLLLIYVSILVFFIPAPNIETIYKAFAYISTIFLHKFNITGRYVNNLNINNTIYTSGNKNLNRLYDLRTY